MICSAWEEEQELCERTSTSESESMNLSASSRFIMMSGRLTQSSGETFKMGGWGFSRVALFLLLTFGSDFLLPLVLVFVTLDKFWVEPQAEEVEGWGWNTLVSEGRMTFAALQAAEYGNNLMGEEKFVAGFQSPSLSHWVPSEWILISLKKTLKVQCFAEQGKLCVSI